MTAEFPAATTIIPGSLTYASTKGAIVVHMVTQKAIRIAFDENCRPTVTVLG